jgi:hypothetical protein
VLEADGELSSIHGVKFCDLDVDGSRSGEPLVNGMEVTIWVCDLDGNENDCTDRDIAGFARIAY